ncbi:MAG: ATP synthase F1 subunit delta [Asticcacaulis sp.]
MPSSLSEQQQYQETEVGERYARAAFDLAQDNKALDKVHGDLAALKALLMSSTELRIFIGSHIYKSDIKLNGLLAVATSKKAGGLKLNDLTKKTLGVLAANGRLDHLLPFITAFNKRYDALKGIVRAEVTSAVALTEQQLENLTQTLGKTLGQSADISTRVDPALLGGLKVRIGSRLFDASLKTKLDSLKFALKRA